MSLFRSEEHVYRWITARHQDRGAVVPLGQIWELARAWYKDPRAADWAPRSTTEAQSVLESVGLTGDFWRL